MPSGDAVNGRYWKKTSAQAEPSGETPSTSAGSKQHFNLRHVSARDIAPPKSIWKNPLLLELPHKLAPKPERIIEAKTMGGGTKITDWTKAWRSLGKFRHTGGSYGGADAGTSTSPLNAGERRRRLRTSPAPAAQASGRLSVPGQPHEGPGSGGRRSARVQQQRQQQIHQVQQQQQAQQLQQHQAQQHNLQQHQEQQQEQGQQEQQQHEQPAGDVQQPGDLHPAQAAMQEAQQQQLLLEPQLGQVVNGGADGMDIEQPTDGVSKR